MLPGADWKPAGHEVHENAPLAEYVFTGHTLHATGPDAFLNLPASHAGHGPPSGPVYLGLHEQLLSLSLFADEFEFAGHKVHAAMLTVSLYVPIAQAVHGPPAGPV
jgi:hypothetical protein